MLKLHLGCGSKKIDGYVNIDVRYQPNVDKVENIKLLRSYKNESVDVIYASHVLEHFSRWEYFNVLQRWYEVLKKGATIRLAVPDFEKVCEYYIEKKSLKEIRGLLYGGQDYAENFHYWCWDYNEIKEDLEKVGFKNVRRYDWKQVEHSNVDDYSQSYLPHMDKERGKLMSLNVEATK